MHNGGIQTMDQTTLVLDRTLLTQEQRDDYDQWERFFHGSDWTRLVERIKPEIELLQKNYTNVRGEQNLGFLQGGLNVYYRVFVNLPDFINAEFLLKTGQLGQEDEEDQSSNDPVAHGDWRS